MPILGNDYQPPSNMPTGLVLGGQGPVQPQQPQRELTLGQMGNVGLQGIGAALSLPRLMAWNAGPALVGRPGQGPQNGAELFQRLGMNQDSPAQRAIGAGLGAGLDFMADPLMLAGMGGSPSQGGAMAGRLERMAGSGMQDAAMASQMRAAQPIAAQPGSSLADVMRRMSVDRPPLVGAPSPMVSPQVSGRLNRAAGQGLGYQMGRSSAAHAAAEMPNFPTPLMTEQFLNPTAVAPQSRLLQRLSGGRSAPPASPEFNVQPFNTSVGPPPAIQASTPTPRPLPNESFPNIPGLTVSDAAAVPPYFNEMRAGAQTIPPNRQRTIFDSPPSGPRPTPDANFQLIPWQPGQHGPPMPPAPGVVGTPARFPVGANQPEELGPLNLRAAYEAMRNPGRGVTFSPRGPTLIDY